MDLTFHNLTGKAQISLRHALLYVKNKITDITGNTSITVTEIASFIKNEPLTNRMDKELLGMQFSFYSLKQEGAIYYLEMKNDQILQLDVHVNDHNIVSYRSYRDHANLSNSIRIPDTLLPE